MSQTPEPAKMSYQEGNCLNCGMNRATYQACMDVLKELLGRMHESKCDDNFVVVDQMTSMVPLFRKAIKIIAQAERKE